MKKDSVLINTARGPVIDEAALTRTLQQGGIAFAALDVFEQELLSSASPLLGLDNTILSSHSLCWTEELFRDMGREAFAGVIACDQTGVARLGVMPRTIQITSNATTPAPSAITG